MRRLIIMAAMLAAIGAIFWVWPPFRIVPLHQARTAKARGEFNAADYALKFWSERLGPTLSRAADANTFLNALRQDPKSAATEYGRTVGMSDTVYYLIGGTGTVFSVEASGVTVSLQNSEGEPDLLLKTGLLFGNTIRDATGLLNPSHFPNSQDFNEISTELNRIVEAKIIPRLKTGAVPGRRIRFVAAVELESEMEVGRPFKGTPLRAEFE